MENGFTSKANGNSSRDFKVKHKSKQKCSSCGKVKMRIRSHRGNGKGRWVFKDENGLIWDSLKCNDCRRKARIKYGREVYGQLPRDLVQNSRYKKGRESEHKAKKYFELLGYKVTLVEVKGPDLTIEKNGTIETVEVKSVTRGRSGDYIVGSVQPNRLNDTYIAYVHEEHICIEYMKKHLKFIGKCGERNVTDIFYPKYKRVNSRKGRTKTGYKGVVLRPHGKYFAYINVKSKQIPIGYYTTAIEAAKCYDKKAKELYGEFAFLNFPNET